MRDEVPAWPPGASRSTTTRAQALRGAVHRRRQAGGTAADDDDVVLGLGRLRAEPRSSATRA